MSTNVLSEQEVAEIKTRPVGLGYVIYSEAQFQLRLSAAKKIWEGYVPSVPSQFVEAYATHPPWAFYTNADGNIPRRVHGVDLTMDGVNMKVVSALFFMVNDVIGGVGMADLKRVDRWSDDHLMKILSGPSPGAFTDPLGFVLFATK